jgi:Leucine-rich repeat (LRR) protein
MFRVPDALFRIRTLKKLDLDGNQLTELPDAIDLPALKELDCESCLLYDCPADESTVRLNKLSRVPDALFRIQTLEVLCLHENLLTELPEAIDMPALNTLYGESFL